MPPEVRAIPGVDDSKQLTPAERERLAPLIRQRALTWALGAASVREIERANIVGATALAIRRAIARLRQPYDVLLLDGKPMRQLEVEHRAVVDADARCYSVACASIVAKVARDRLLRSLAVRHPWYGWERNAGYGTEAHLLGLRQRGLTAHHRVGFCRSALSGNTESQSQPQTTDHSLD